jgi:hypothetical protein
MRRHRLAELAVVDNVDAGIALFAYHIGDRTGEAFCVSRVVFALAARPRPVHLDEVRRPRQAAGVGGENPFGAAFHGLASPRPRPLC